MRAAPLLEHRTIRTGPRTLAVLLAVLTTACAATMNETTRVEQLRSRASFDLACETDLQIVRLTPTSYGVVGCGRRAAYVLDTCGDGALVHSCHLILDGVAVEGEAIETATVAGEAPARAEPSSR